MSDPVRRRRRHVRKSSELAPAASNRVVLRRRRCEPEPGASRFRRGSGWRQTLLVGLTLLAAGPVWALGEAVAARYHEEFAVFVQQARAHLGWAVAPAPEADVPIRPYVPDAPAASHGSGDLSGSRFVSLSDGAPGTGLASRSATLPARAYNAPRVPAPVTPSFAASAFNTFAPAFETRGVGRRASAVAGGPRVSPAAAGVRPALAGSMSIWTGSSAATSANWSTGGNWYGGLPPANDGSADLAFTPAPPTATASNVDVNYAINSLTFARAVTNSQTTVDTPPYTLTASSGVRLTVGAGGIADASASMQTINAPVVLGAAQAWNVSTAAGALAVNGVISGTGALTKSGPGTLVLGGSGSNTYTGLTSVTGGTLALAKTAYNIIAVPGDLSIGNAINPGAAGSAVAQLRNDGQTAATTNVTIYPDGLFDVANGSGTGQTSNNEALIKNLTMTGGEVRLGAGGIRLSGITTNASATSALISSTDSFDNVLLFAGVTANVARGTATYDLDVRAGMADGALTKTGAGVLRLAGNTNGGQYGSSVTLRAGTIALAGNTVLGTGNDGFGASTFTFAGGTVTADGGDRTIANPIALTGDATIGDSLDGTPHAITFTGATTLDSSHTLTVNNTAATTFSGAVNMGGNTLTIDGTGNTLISGVVSGNADGGLTKQGTGTLTLTANNPYAGNTVVQAGALMVNDVPVKPGDAGTGTGTVFVGPGAWLGGTGVIGGNVAVGVLPGFNPPATARGAGPRFVVSSGVLTPGVNGPGILTVNGGVTFASNGTLEADLAGANPGTGYDQVKVGGSLTLSGTLTLTSGAGVNLFVGEKFYVLDLTSTVGTVTGTFENGAAGGVFADNAGDTFQIKYNDTDPTDGNAAANDVSLTVLTVPEPGTWATLGLGAAATGLGRCRRRRRL